MREVERERERERDDSPAGSSPGWLQWPWQGQGEAKGFIALSHMSEGAWAAGPVAERLPGSTTAVCHQYGRCMYVCWLPRTLWELVFCVALEISLVLPHWPDNVRIVISLNARNQGVPQPLLRVSVQGEHAFHAQAGAHKSASTFTLCVLRDSWELRACVNTHRALNMHTQHFTILGSVGAISSLHSASCPKTPWTICF